MNTDQRGVSVHLDGQTDWNEPMRNLRRWWSVITSLIAVAIFIQAILAGAMLSGISFAHEAHSATATILIALALIAGLVSVITLRRVANGTKLGLTLLMLAAVLVLQTALGKLSANGANLMWVHVPLGVALVGFAAQAIAGARKLGTE
ncbi:MAG: hypothetical protein Q7T44_10545 [Parvibaculum sp.]|nr:hypothetical protein [Parvibaculum sp.]